MADPDQMPRELTISYMHLTFGSFLINLNLLFLNLPFIDQLAPQFEVLVVLIVLFFPCLPFPMYLLQTIVSKHSSGSRFEWSIYGAAVCTFLIKVCFLAGSHVEQKILLVPVVIFLMAISQIFAGNMIVDHDETNVVYFRKYQKTSKFETFLLSMYVITFTLSFCFSSTGLSELKVCSTDPFKCYAPEIMVRSFFIMTTVTSLTVFYEAIQVFKARELVLESVYEPTGLIRKQILIRKGWKWVVDEGPMKHIEMDRLEFV